MAWPKIRWGEDKLPLWLCALTLVVAVGAALGTTAAIVTLQSHAARHLRAETRVVSMEGLAWAMRGVHAAALMGGPADRLHQAHTIVAAMVPEEDAALARLVPESHTAEFRGALGEFRTLMDREWVRTLEAGPSDGFAVDVMPAAFDRVVETAAATRTELSDQAASAFARARILTGGILVAGAFIALAILAYADRLRRTAAVRIAHERALTEAERRYRSMSRHAEEMMAVLSEDGRLMYASQAFERIFGWKLDDRIGQQVGRFVHPDDLPRVSKEYAELAGTPGVSIRQEYRAKDSRGAWHWIDVTLTNLLEDPAVGGIVWTARLTDAQKNLEERVAYGLSHDTLTGLANRTAFARAVAETAASRQAPQIAVLFIDLDDFKKVNNGMSQAAGDALLVRVAQRLRRCIRSGMTLARLGGDEFAILTPDTTAQAAGGLADRIIARMTDAFHISGRDMFIQCSIGVALGGAATLDADGIMSEAHIALLAAKKAGKARHVIFEEPMSPGDKDLIQLEVDLRRGLDAGEVVVHYQPIIDLATRRVRRVEALARWEHPDRGLLAPALFMEAAARIGLIIPIGRRLLGEACRQAAEWRRSHPGAADLTLAVNLSSVELRSPNLVDDIERACAVAGLPPEVLTIEVTETVLTEEVDEVATVLARLRERAFRIAVDDFGTGYSSLSHLKRFSVDELKIDRSFVDGADEDPGMRAMIRAVVKLAEDLSLETVAEGVETDAQEEVVRSLGCRLAQGYRYAPALSAGALAALLIDPAEEMRLAAAG